MNICFQLQNGEEVTGRTEEWIAAIIASLPEAQKTAVFERVARKLIGFKTPGSHVLRAEPSRFTLSGLKGG